LLVSGATSFSAGDDILLTQAGNNFAGVVNASGNDISLTDGSGGLSLGTVTTTGAGNLTVASNGGALDLGSSLVSGNVVATATTLILEA
jgi:hypothetical protein